MTDKLADLYEKYGKLAEAKDVSQLSDHYVSCIEGTKCGDKEKQLAAQIISKFFKHFPSLQDKALNAVLDLCEDDNSQIRICAMKQLPIISKDSKEHLSKIADILAQLLQLEDQDYAVACNCLVQVYKQDPLLVTKIIFNSMHSTTDYNLREKCISFLFQKLIKIPEKMSQELEEVLIEESKKSILESSPTEFSVLMSYLKTSKCGKTVQGTYEVVNLVADKAELDKDFDPLDEESNDTARVILCVESVLPFFNASVHSDKFLIYYCDQILPQLNNIIKVNDGEAIKIRLLRQLAELSFHCGKLENPSLHVVQIFDKLKDYMPPPPAEIVEMPNLDFTSVECLLYSFHRLARQCPDFLTADPSVLKDFRSRLTYFSRGVQGCKKSLEAVIGSKVPLANENAVKAKLAPSVLNNINTLIKDLFYTPPVYKCNVTLSFKGEVTEMKATVEKSVTAQKRHTPITFDASNGNTKHPRNKTSENIKLYTPPSGKFSNNFQSYDRSGGRPRGGNRGRGGRGRGTWRK